MYFTLYWNDGRRQVIEGRDIEDAWLMHIPGADPEKIVLYDEGDTQLYKWNPKKKDWDEVLENYYTLYKKDGTREVVGKKVLTAFDMPFLNPNVHAYKEVYCVGINRDFNWSSFELCWKRRTVMSLQSTAAFFKPNMEKVATDLIISGLNECESISIEFPNKDRISISDDWIYHYVDRDIGTRWVRCIKILYGEYSVGSYSGCEPDEKNQHHYMVCAQKVYSPKDAYKAVKALLAWIAHINNNTNEVPSFEGTTNLNTLYENQISYEAS